MKKHTATGKGIRTLVALAGFALIVNFAGAATNMEAKNSTTTGLTFGGDLRIRHESFFNKTAGTQDRHRERFRLRFGVDAKMDKFEAGLGLASGTGEQTSTNQTMGNGWNEKNIYIEKAFASYKPLDWLKATGGKMANPFYRNYSSDIIFDSDLNPEGFSQQLEKDLGTSVTMFGNFFQGPINEINGNNPQNNNLRKRDPWFFGNQIGVKTKLGSGVRWNFAIANYSATHETKNVLLSTATSDSPIQQGDNTRVAAGSGLLAGKYEMLHFMTEVGFQALIPVRVQADYVKNVANGRGNASNFVRGQDKGYQLGMILGSAKNAGSWEFAYFHKYLEANATLSDFSDSDWGNGGTNRKGHILWLGYAATDFLTLQGKYFMTKRANPYIATSNAFGTSTTASFSDINRFQLDAVVKF